MAQVRGLHKCPTCGQVFYGQRIYCSKKCKERMRILDGSNQRRMLEREARKHGLSREDYEAVLREQEEFWAERRADRAAGLTGAAHQVWFKNCEWCGKLFTARNIGALTCSEECQRKRQSKLVSNNITARYRSDPEFRDSVLSKSHERRASRLGIEGLGQIRLIRYLGERDRWRCGICGELIHDKSKASPDHIEPLSKGGLHVLENLQISHVDCNLKKGNRGGNEQLRIVG